MTARRCIEDLTVNQVATCRGDPAALHRMRIALTRLRTAISFFSPIVADAQRAQIRRELKWLNACLGAVRDLDVAIERLGNRRNAVGGNTRLSALDREVRDGHTKLARALRSTRYRRLVNGTSAWVESGSWSTEQGKQVARARACPIATFITYKLARWQRKLLKKSRKLEEMGIRRRHQLRLRNKKLSYSLEFFKDLFPDKRYSRQRLALKYLRRAQKSLGQLNDDARARSLAAASGVKVSRQKREKQLIKAAAKAYRSLAALKPAFR